MSGPKPKLPSELFWKHVPQRGPEECWEWTAVRLPKGYGQFHVAGKTVLAHRFAYELYFGSIAPGIVVCHRCDNPPCVNPAHLFAGTTSDNQRDKVAKGRAVSNGPKIKGEGNGRARLSAEDVVAIRALHAATGESAARIADRYGISPTAARKIVVRETWKHVA